MGISNEEAQDKFGFLLDAFAFGAPPHGGIAFGWDRVTALLAGTSSIREVIAFPKSGGGVDPLTDAPPRTTRARARESGAGEKPEKAENTGRREQDTTGGTSGQWRRRLTRAGG